MRFLTQPGPAHLPRQLYQWDDDSRSFLIHLREGWDLLEGLLEASSRAGFSQAGLILLGGTFQKVSYMTGRADPSGYRAATHHGPWSHEGPLTITGGSAMIGLDEKGEPMIHCHAFFAMPEGALKGGHLRRGACPLAKGGAKALAAVPKRAGFQVAFDEETNFPIFQPMNFRPEGK